MAAERPYLVGLTGSIGMGKSETAKLFVRLGIPVYDADAAVHRLYEKDGAAVPKIAKTFPGCVVNGRVNRPALAAAIREISDGLKTLESLVHPLVAEEEKRFLQQAQREGAEMVVLDIPLLYEAEKHTRMDAIVVVSAPLELQRERVLARAGMTAEKLDHILARQMPDAEKRGQADFVVETDKGVEHAFAQVKKIVEALHKRRLEKRAERHDA
jgi:dephospho-CoA kinase